MIDWLRNDIKGWGGERACVLTVVFLGTGLHHTYIWGLWGTL